MLKHINRVPDYEFFNYVSQKENIIEIMQILEAIPKQKFCDKCKKRIKIKRTTKYNFGYCWKCSKCKGTVNISSDCSLADKRIGAGEESGKIFVYKVGGHEI
ncbi:hypothetical protein DMUE_3298 [Dictyocoela muelleri]|nr:hypothetical protein DMUE_3298 [Dictyocoela muelleri]